MNKRFLFIAAAVLLIGGLATLLVTKLAEPARDGAVNEREIYEAMKQLGRIESPEPAASPAFDASRPTRLAVGGLGLSDDAQNRRLGDLTTAELTSAPGIELVERQSLDAVLREAELSLSGLVRAKDAVRIGKLLRVDWFLLGTAARVNGSNALVARVVDARTGILREAGVFPGNQAPTRLAADLARFVRHCRQSAVDAKPRVYLAIGAFEDLSLNNRQVAFPSQLRSYLTASLPGTNVTLLEREAVNALLQEVRMDLAGLTDAGTNAPPPMQFAYWMVGGYYQSYGDFGDEVELVLNTRRMFGRNLQAVLRGRPGESFFQQVKNTIEAAMRQAKAISAPTRGNEARNQLVSGKELAQVSSYELRWSRYEGTLRPQELARQRRNTEEAISAFEAVLLLDPTNREAKMYLAACFRRSMIGRVAEARDYYREILDEPIEDKWFDLAKEALKSFVLSDPEAGMNWYRIAAENSNHALAAEFYRSQIEAGHAATVIEKGDGPQVRELFEARLLQSVRSYSDAMHGKGGNLTFGAGMGDFVETFGTNRVAAAQRLVELLPRIKAEAPDLEPYLLAAVVTYQVDTNSSVVGEFQRMLDWCLEHPDQLFKAKEFWSNIAGPVYNWSMGHRLYGFAIRVLEQQSLTGNSVASSPLQKDAGKMAFAYAYLGAERWKEALDILQTYSNRPVFIGNGGPWGRPAADRPTGP